MGTSCRRNDFWDCFGGQRKNNSSERFVAPKWASKVANAFYQQQQFSSNCLVHLRLENDFVFWPLFREQTYWQSWKDQNASLCRKQPIVQDIWLGCKLSSLLRFVLDLNQSGLKHSSLPSTSFKFIFTTTIHFFAGKTRRCPLDVTVYLIVCGARCHQGTPVWIHAWVLYGCRYQCVPRAQALLSPDDKLQWHSRYNFFFTVASLEDGHLCDCH